MTDNLWDLTGRKALVTGASYGIGKAIAEGFLQKGAEVFITARDIELIKQLEKEWEKAGYTAFGASCDVTQSDQREQLVTKIGRKWNNLDILVNNVGPNFKKPVVEYTLEEYAFLVESNMTSTFHITQLCCPLLKASNQSSIINISAVSSAMAFKGSGPFGMAKAGVESFTRTLAVELGKDGIRANAILPGFTATETFLKKYDEEYLQKALKQIPLNRMGNAMDIANLACYLAMPASSYITGQCITIDGGFTCYGFGGVNAE